MRRSWENLLGRRNSKCKSSIVWVGLLHLGIEMKVVEVIAEKTRGWRGREAKVNLVLILDVSGNNWRILLISFTSLKGPSGCFLVNGLWGSNRGQGGKMGVDLATVHTRCGPGWFTGASDQGGSHGWALETLEKQLIRLAAELDLGRKRGIGDICLSMLFTVFLFEEESS